MSRTKDRMFHPISVPSVPCGQSQLLPTIASNRNAWYKIPMAAPLKIGFLGAGKMATALARGFINAKLVKPGQIFAADPYEAARKYFGGETGGKIVVDNL